MRYHPRLLSAIVICLFVLTAAAVSASTMNLLDALNDGAVRADFRGTGDTGVDAIIERAAGGPDYVTVSPGTQFWAQRGGLQGQTTLGWVPIDVGADGIAHVQIPTACTNINLPAPTPDDAMWPEPAPSGDMMRLCSIIRPENHNPQVAQLAVWAVANDPSRQQLASHERDMITDEEASAAEREEAFDTLLRSAAALLKKAGLQPRKFRMFRHTDLGQQ
ncbi:MAG: hypothetical protein ACLFWB_03430 [Armatimonadota bacterium]